MLGGGKECFSSIAKSGNGLNILYIFRTFHTTSYIFPLVNLAFLLNSYRQPFIVCVLLILLFRVAYAGCRQCAIPAESCLALKNMKAACVHRHSLDPSCASFAMRISIANLSVNIYMTKANISVFVHFLLKENILQSFPWLVRQLKCRNLSYTGSGL